LSSSSVIFPIGIGRGWRPRLPYTKAGSNTSRKVLEKQVDAGENRELPKTKAMLRTLTIVLMTNPSRGSAFYFRRRDSERFDRYLDILTWTHFETLQIA
jgi:hypothetical protein